MVTPLPDDPFPPRNFRAGMVVGALLVVVAVLGTIVVALVIDGDGTDRAGSPSSSPSPSSTPVPQSRPPRVVRSAFLLGRSAEGERLSLRVYTLKKDPDCKTHYFQFLDKPINAFLADCDFLVDQGYQVIFFHASLKNRTSRPLSFNLRDFVLTDTSGDTYGPVNIRSLEGVAAANYIPERGRLLPHARVDGWLTFDARTGGAPPIARRLSYIDGGQTLTILFEGIHGVA